MDEDNYYEHSLAAGTLHLLYVCKRDGLAVADTDLHDKWHEQQALVARRQWGGMHRPGGGR